MAAKRMRHEAQKTNIPDTLIPVETTITGNIQTSTGIRVDGRVIGDVNAKGDVTLGPKALIEGDVSGISFNIAGTVSGNIIADGSVTLLSESRVLGDILSITLKVEHGASYGGTCAVGATHSAKILPQSSAGSVPAVKQTCAEPISF